jgi:hypothetical protein
VQGLGATEMETMMILALVAIFVLLSVQADGAPEQ